MCVKYCLLFDIHGGFGREENISKELKFSSLVVREECDYEGYHLVIITDPRASYQVYTQVAVNHQQMHFAHY